MAGLFANASRAARTLVLYLLAPTLIGIVTGSCVSGASTVVERWALGQLATLPGLLPIVGAPLALVVTLGVVVYVTRVATPSTAELYIVTYHDPNGRIPLWQLPGRVLAAATTVGFGGAQGLESPSALMGAGFGDVLGRRGARLAPYEARSLMIAGASAGIAAVFSSPALGTFYGMEVPFRHDVDARRFVPCAVAAAASYITRWWLIGPRRLVVMSGRPTIDLSFVAGVALVALACGIGARLFASVDEWLHARAQHHTRLGRALAAGLVLGGSRGRVTRFRTNGSPSVRATLLWTGCFPVLILGGRLQEFSSCARRRRSPVCMEAVAAGCSPHWPAAAHSSDNWLLRWLGRRRRLSSPCSAQPLSWERAIVYRLAAPCSLRRPAVSLRLQRQARWPLVSVRSSWARRQSPTPRPTAAQCTARSRPSQLSNFSQMTDQNQNLI